MAYAANMGLSRHECRTCKSETLHRNGGCIHCGTAFQSVVRRLKVNQPFRMANSIKRARA